MCNWSCLMSWQITPVLLAPNLNTNILLPPPYTTVLRLASFSVFSLYNSGLCPRVKFYPGVYVVFEVMASSSLSGFSGVVWLWIMTLPFSLWPHNVSCLGSGVALQITDQNMFSSGGQNPVPFLSSLMAENPYCFYANKSDTSRDLELL